MTIHETWEMVDHHATATISQSEDSMKPYRTAIAVMVLTAGCATQEAAIRSDTPLQKALTGWGYFMPAGIYTIFMGITGGQSECEGLRQRTMENSTPRLPSSCVPMTVTTE